MDDSFFDFRDGRITATECAETWRSSTQNAHSECSVPGWARGAFDSLTHCGTTWQQFAEFLHVLSIDAAKQPPASNSIRGTGRWKSNPLIRVFVDLDGVVSPILVGDGDARWKDLVDDPLTNDDEPPSIGWDDWTCETIDFVPVPRELLRSLARLAARPAIDVAWLTTWEENANLLFEDMAMPDRLPVYRFDWHGADPVTKWSTVVHEHEQQPLPFVWIDDHLGVDEYRWARHLDVSSLVIRTNTFHGITRGCWDHIETWIAERLGDSIAASASRPDDRDWT